MNTRPPAQPDAEPRVEHPRWAVKPLRQLTTGELAEALEYLERNRPDDDVLGRALAGEFARRTAAEYHRTGERGGRPEPGPYEVRTGARGDAATGVDPAP